MSISAAKSIFDDSLFSPSSLHAEGRDSGSYGHRIAGPSAGAEPVIMGFWMAEPGTYNHPGGTGGETFIVVEGEATIVVPEMGETELAPGVVFVIPPNMPSTMRVRTLLRKFSVVPR